MGANRRVLFTAPYVRSQHQMTPEALEALIAAGATADMIAAAWRAEMHMLSVARDAKRAKDAARKARSRNVTQCHADIDGQSVTACDIADPLSLDKEKSPKPPKEINPNPATDGRARTRGSRLSDGWRPTTCDPTTKAGEVIARRGQQWARETLETFTNHWRGKAGRDACKVDWQATWANWVVEQDRRDQRNGGNRNGANASNGGGDGFTRALRRASAKLAADDNGGMPNDFGLG